MIEMKNLKIDHIHLDKKGLGVVANDLEANLLSHLWGNGPSTVKIIHQKEGRKLNVALTTIAVTLDRMHSKGLTKRKLEKGRGGLKYIYSASLSREELGKSLAQSVAEKLTSAFGESVSSYFRGNV